MALQAQAQLLDELMGKFRNVVPGDKVTSTRFDDSDVCRYYLCGFCPHDLFVNTKADLGPCSKTHDDELKRQYEKSSRFGRLGYEDEFERFLRTLLNDVEKKIKRGMDRLKLTQSEANSSLTPLQIKQEKVAQLKEKINSLIKQAESLGEEGNIEEAQDTLEQCEKFKSECRYLENQLEQNPNGLDQKQMEVCEICGAFLIVNDAQSRIEEHVLGKQHSGYAKVRSTLEEMKKKRQQEFEEKEKERERLREKERKRREEHSGSSSSSKYHERSRDRRRGTRSRSRDRNKRTMKHSRSRSRSRSKRERDYHDRSFNRRTSTSRSSSKDKKHRSSRNSRERDNGYNSRHYSKQYSDTGLSYKHNGDEPNGSNLNQNNVNNSLSNVNDNSTMESLN